jgi:hypothetical protein
MAERARSRTSQRRLSITVVLAAVLAIVAAFSLAQRIPAISHRYSEIDFVNSYGWWTDYSRGGDPWVVQNKPTELSPGLERPRYCNYPPFYVVLFSPLARFDQKTAFWIWEAAQLLCVAAAVLMLARGIDPPLGGAPTIIVLSLVLVSRQVAGAMVAAQVTPMLLALMIGSWFCARREHPAAAGLWLALAALFKLYPVTAGGYFLFGRRWRPLGWAIAFFVAGVLLSNPRHWLELVTLEMPVSYHVVARAELTVLPFVRKWVAHFAGTTIFTTPVFAVFAIATLIDLALLAIAAAASITSRGRDDLDGLVFGIWVALALLLSPIAWIPETLLLLPAYLYGMLAAWEAFQRPEARRNVALIAATAILALCIATGLIKAIPHPGFPVLLAAYLAAALIFRVRMQSDGGTEAGNRAP